MSIPTPALTIAAIHATPVIVPLDRPITTASGQVDRAPLILIDLDTREGVTGRAYLFAYFALMLKSLHALVTALAPLVIGDELRPQVIDAKLHARFTLLGGRSARTSPASMTCSWPSPPPPRTW
jgi:mandelate racemase